MRKRVFFLGLILTFALALPASAQTLFGSGRSNTTGATIPSNSPGFFSVPLAKPSFLGMGQKPTLPQPLNLTGMMPSWSHIQSTMLMRNVFSGPQAMFQMGGQQAAPPTAKKKMSLLP